MAMFIKEPCNLCQSAGIHPALSLEKKFGMFKSQKPREDDDDLLAVLFCLADSSDYSDEETESRTARTQASLYKKEGLINLLKL